MAWYDEQNNAEVLSEAFDGTIPKDQFEDILESVALDADQIKQFAAKFGLETTKDDDGEYVAIPTDHFKNANFTSQFLDFWIGNTAEKLALEQKRQIRNNSYRLMDEILGEATLSLDMYADEAVGVGFIEQPIDIDIESTDESVAKNVMEILQRNDFIKHSRSHIRNLVKWGDLGVQLMLPESGSDPLDIKLLTHTPDCWTVFSPANCKVAVGYSLIPETIKSATRSSLGRDRMRMEDVMQPWEFVQFSVFDSEYCPYGRGLLEGLRTAFDQLVTIEALLAMSRATRVERLLVKIPTGTTNPTAALTKLNDLKSRFKNTIFSDKSNGRKSYAKNPAMQDIMFVPADGEFEIDRLQSGSGVEISSTDDVEYFRDKVLMVTGIPKGILLADESTDRYHALAQQDLKFARKLIPFQDAYAEGLTKLCMLLVGYVGGNIEDTKVTVKIKRPVQVSGQILEQIEAASRTAIEFIDNFKRSQEDNEGNQPEVPKELYSDLLAQLGVPEDIIRLLDGANKNDPPVPPNVPDDDNISMVTASTDARLAAKYATIVDSGQILKSNVALFNVFKSSANDNLLVEVIENCTDKKKMKELTVIKRKNIPK